MKKSNNPVNSEDFENQLRRQPIQRVPTPWRDEILAAASAEYAGQPATPNAPTLQPALYHQIIALLWPCPQAWAGLAAVWLMIAVFNFFTVPPVRETMTIAKTPPSPEVIVAYKKEQRELAQLIESFDQPAVEPPKPYVPRPRSEREMRIIMV
jgi:hypothetical protein